MSVNTQSNILQSQDLRDNNDLDITNSLLQKTWPGAVGETADWPGLCALLVIIRQIYSMMPLNLRVKYENREQEITNPILRLAWMPVPQEMTSEYSSLWKFVRQMLHPDPSKPLPTLWGLFTSSIMTDTLWSRDEFLLEDQRYLSRPASAGEECQWERGVSDHPKAEVARRSLITYDGSNHLSEVIASIFGKYGPNDDEPDPSNAHDVMVLFNCPMFIRVLYHPKENTEAQRFKDLTTIKFEVQEMQDHGGDGRKAVWVQHEYVLIATARPDPENSGRDFVRLYNLDGYIVPPESLNGSPIVSSTWQVGISSQAYLLIYGRTSPQVKTPSRNMAEARETHPRIGEYHRIIGTLGGGRTIESTTSGLTVPATSQQDLLDTRVDKGQEGGLAVSSTEIPERLSKTSLQPNTTAEQSGTPMSTEPTPSSSQRSQFSSSGDPQLGSAELGFGSTPVLKNTRRLIPTATQLSKHESMSSYRPQAPSGGRSVDQLPAGSRDQLRPRTRSTSHLTSRTSMASAPEDDIEDDEQGYTVNTRRGPGDRSQTRPHGRPQLRPRPTEGVSRGHQYTEDEVMPRTDSQLALPAGEHSNPSHEELKRGDETRSLRKRPVPSGSRGDREPSKKRRNVTISSSNAVPLGSRSRKDASDPQPQSEQGPS